MSNNGIEDLYPFESVVTRTHRHRLNQHKSGCLWFFGLSGSGKSTLAHAVEEELYNRGVRSYVLDGDNIRKGLNRDLGLSEEDRKENIRRVGEVAKIMVDAGLLTLAAFITPYEHSRQQLREQMKGYSFFECYVMCSLDSCLQRDPKGLYAKAKQGLIKNMTGIGAPFEEPSQPSLVVNTEEMDLEQSVEAVINFLITKDLLRP